MGRIHETAASLRFVADDLEPGEITRLLGAEPHLAYRKGDIVERRSSPATYGMWLRKVPRRSPGDLDGQVADLFDGLSPELDRWRDLASRYRAEVFVGLFLRNGNQGITLSAATLSAMASRGLVLDFDIYGQ